MSMQMSLVTINPPINKSSYGYNSDHFCTWLDEVIVPIFMNDGNLNKFPQYVSDGNIFNCQALVPNPSPPSPKSPQTQSQPTPTQFKTQTNPKGTGADTKIL